MTFYLCECCNSVFTTKMRRPMALPCGHTFCLSCIKSQYLSNNYVKCFKCSTKHRLHFDHYPTNYSILDKIYSNNTTHLNNNNNLNANSNSKDAYGNQVFTIESFSIIKGELIKNPKRIIEKQSLISLFNYFEVMKSIVTYPSDSNNWFRKILKIVYIPLIILLLVMANYVCLMHFRFAEIFFVVSILYQTEENVDEICKKTKLWLGYISLHLVNNFVEYVWITNWVIARNVMVCLRTLYVILVLGNENSLNAVVFRLFTVLNKLNLLVR